MKLPELREAVRISLGDDAVSPTTYTSDDAIDQWLRHGIRRISRLRPQYATTTLTPATGTVRYAAPTGIVSLVRVARLADSSDLSEYEVPAVYEPAANVIHLTDGGDYNLPTGDDFTVEYMKEYTVPQDDDTDTDVPEKYLDAVQLYATAQALTWRARNLLSSEGGGGFVIGRYEEKGEASVKSLREEAKQCMDEFNELIGRGDPAIEFSSANVNRTERAPSLTGVTFDEYGWTGEDDVSGMRPNSPGSIP